MTARAALILAPLLCALGASSVACSSEVTTGGSSGGEACSDYRAPASPPWTKVTVRLRNNTLAPLYLGSQGGCGLTPFTLKDAGGDALLWRAEACSPTCEAQQSGSCVCDLDCALPPVFLIPAGGAYETTWEGSIFARASMPATCFKDPSCAAGGCLLEQSAPTGVLELSATLWDTVTDCPMGMAGCACDPGAQGYCQIDGVAQVGGTQRSGSSKLMYPGAKLVEVVFQ